MSSQSKADTAMEASVETKSTLDQSTTDDGFAIYATRGVDPELLAAIRRISPDRRIEIEKRVRRKIDSFLFPLLLIFYILNYIVRQ